MQQKDSVVPVRGSEKSWLANPVIQKNLRLVVSNGDTKDYDTTRELTDVDVREVVGICDAALR